MYPTIDKIATGKQIKKIMDEKGITVRQIQQYLGLSCVQGIYHWFDGSSLPTLDNLYALSELLQVPMDVLVQGNRKPLQVVLQDKQYMRLMAYYARLQVA